MWHHPVTLMPNNLSVNGRRAQLSLEEALTHWCLQGCCASLLFWFVTSCGWECEQVWRSSLLLSNSVIEAVKHDISLYFFYVTVQTRAASNSTSIRMSFSEFRSSAFSPNKNNSVQTQKEKSFDILLMVVLCSQLPQWRSLGGTSLYIKKWDTYAVYPWQVAMETTQGNTSLYTWTGEDKKRQDERENR